MNDVVRKVCPTCRGHSRDRTATPSGTCPNDWHRYRVTRLKPGRVAEAVAERTHPRQNSFDQSYNIGRLPAWVRRWGTAPHDEADPEFVRPYYPEPAPLGYNRPGAEEPYVQALVDFFQTRIDNMAPKPRQNIQDVRNRLLAVMHDRRTQEDQAKDAGVTQQAVSIAQARAVEQLVESCGGKLALAEKLRQFLHDKEQQDGRERLKYLPRWVHG